MTRRSRRRHATRGVVGLGCGRWGGEVLHETGDVMCNGGGHASMMMIRTIACRARRRVRSGAIGGWRVVGRAGRLSDRRLGHLGLLLEVLGDERRREHVLLVVGELGSIGVLLSIRVGDGLIECTSHRHVVGEIGGETAIEVRRAGLEVGRQSSVLKREVVVFLFVHFLVDDVLFRHSQRATRSSLVDLRGASSGLDAGLETAITSPRSGNVCSGEDQSKRALSR